MKKIITLSLTLALCATSALAANQQQMQSGGLDANGQQIQSQQQVQNQGEEQQLQEAFMLENQEKAGTVSEVRNMIQQRSQELNQEIEDLSGAQQKVYQNQNAVREAVHGLLAVEDLAQGIGPQVSQIARDFNNSIKNTVAAEEKIQKRSAIARFFIGGEKNAAQELEQELEQNQERIQELKQLKDQCSCSEEVKTLIQEQIQEMDQEQLRLQELTEREKNSNGIFGWVRNLFK
jgi:hypothetical protein